MASFLSFMEYLRLGQIVKTFGLEGQVRCFSLTDFASARFAKGTKLSLLNEKTGERKEVTVALFRDSREYYFLGFEEIKTIEEAQTLAGLFIEMDKAKAPLPRGYYRLQDLMGCDVIDAESGNKLGVVSDILAASSTKTLVVSRIGGKNFFVPFVNDEFIVKVDIKTKKITIKVIPGLL